MSPPDSTEVRPGLYVPKPRPDIYTVILAIALVALIVACVCLWLELSEYQWATSAPRGELAPRLYQEALRPVVRC